MRPNELLTLGLLALLCGHDHGPAAALISCPKEVDATVFRKVCYHSEVNITMLRCLHDFGDEVYVNYTIDRITQDRTPPIAVDVYPSGQEHEAFRCDNGTIRDIADSRIVLMRVLFKPGCKDPILIINKTATANITLDVFVNFTDIDMLCNTITIGPQRLNLSCQMDPETGELTPLLRLQNVTACDTSGPDVPIKLSAYASGNFNSSITLHSDGNQEPNGGISVQPLPCSDSHIQEYRVYVNSTEDYTLTGEILFALLPESCIPVTESSCPAVTNSPVDIVIAIAIPLTVVAAIIVIIITIVLVVLCYRRCRKESQSQGTYEARDPYNKRPESLPPSQETNTPSTIAPPSSQEAKDIDPSAEDTTLSQFHPQRHFGGGNVKQVVQRAVEGAGRSRHPTNSTDLPLNEPAETDACEEATV